MSEEMYVVLSQDPKRAEQMGLAQEFVDDGAGYRITAQDVRAVVLRKQQAHEKETKALEDNILIMLKVKDCVFPDGTTVDFGYYGSTPSIMAKDYEDLKKIRKILIKAKLKYSDSISTVSPVGWNDDADVVFQTSLGFNLRTQIPIKDFPQELLPSEECMFEKKSRTPYVPSPSWELSCPMQK